METLQPEILNIASHTVVNTPVVFLAGTHTGHPLSVSGVKASVVHDDGNGRFRAFVELRAGLNTVFISDENGKDEIELEFVPDISCTKFNTCCLVPDDYDASLPVLHGYSIESLNAKLSTGLKLLQAIAAEGLAAHGYTRKSFCLHFTATGEVDIDFVKVKAPDKVLRNIKSESELRRLLPLTMQSRKPAIFLSTWARVEKGARKGHIGSGGNGQAFHSTWGLDTWPSSLSQVFDCAMDPTPAPRIAVDSHQSRGSIFLNHLSGLLHEIGHACELRHIRTSGIMDSKNPRIMAGPNRKVYPFLGPPVPCPESSAVCYHDQPPCLWGEDHAAWLSAHQYFRYDQPSPATLTTTACHEKGYVRVMSDSPLLLITFVRDELDKGTLKARQHVTVQTGTPTTDFKVPLSKIIAGFEMQPDRIRVKSMGQNGACDERTMPPV